jgi:hypothetical protein
MGSPPIISATKPNQEQRAISTIVTGFSADPVARWFLPQPLQYLTYFPRWQTPHPCGRCSESPTDLPPV